MAGKIVALKPARTQDWYKPPMGPLIDFADGVQALAAELALFRLALYGAVVEASELLLRPDLKELMEPVIGQSDKLHEKASALVGDVYGVVGGVGRSPRPGRRS